MSSRKLSKRRRSPAAVAAPGLSLTHLRRETRTALELAVVALAPSDLLERLAAAAGLLEALIELPSNSPPALALLPSVVQRAQDSLEQWKTWRRQSLEPKMPRS